jgi:hypothetical protein
MPNFQNGKVYAIRSHQTDKIYIGSTTQPLSVRFGEHKRKPCTSREILNFNDAYIELLEEFPCANKMQLTKREGQLIRSTDCVNKRIEGRTQSEHYKDNKEHFQQYKKQYYVENKDEILEQQKHRYQDNKEQILEQHKQYYVDNKQEINEKQKHRYQDNKEQIKEHANQKYNCFCSGKYTLCGKSKHFKTAKHLAFINSLETTTI